MKRKFGARLGKMKDGHSSIGLRLVVDDTKDEYYLEFDIYKLKLRIGALRKYIKAGDK